MKKLLPILSLLWVLLTGCQAMPEAPTAPPPKPASPTEPSASPTVSPAPSATRQPPLREREWTPSLVLLRLDLIRKTKEILNPPAPPQFLLYADGKAFLTRPAIEGYPHGDQQLLFKQMERSEVCRLLNTLDQTGFLDYNPAEYSYVGGEHNEEERYDVYLEVNAWKSHKGTYPQLPLYALEEWTGGARAQAQTEGGFPVLSPALSKAYALAVDYPAEGFALYAPEKMGVWIRPLNPAEFPNLTWENWSFPALTISYLYSKMENGGASGGERFAILRKQGAANLYQYLKESFSTKYYVEINRLGEKAHYAVYARPLLPYELPGSFEMETPVPALPLPKLQCAPADGVMDIPQPRLIYTIPIP